MESPESRFRLALGGDVCTLTSVGAHAIAQVPLGSHGMHSAQRRWNRFQNCQNWQFSVPSASQN